MTEAEQQVKKILKWFAETKAEHLTWNVSSDTQTKLSGYAGMIEEEYARLEMKQPIFMTGVPNQVTVNETGGFKTIKISEAERERLWLASPEGQRQIELKYLLKTIDRVIAACKERKERFNAESHNRL